MTPTDKEIIEEARKRRHAAGYGLGANLGLPPLDHYIIKVAREGWKPPAPEPVDPDLMAFREWVATSPFRFDEDLCEAYLAGARMAREKEGGR